MKWLLERINMSRAWKFLSKNLKSFGVKIVKLMWNWKPLEMEKKSVPFELGIEMLEILFLSTVLEDERGRNDCIKTSSHSDSKQCAHTMCDWGQVSQRTVPSLESGNQF